MVQTAATPAPEVELLTIREAARLAGVSESTAYRLLKRGEWPSVRLSHKLVRVPLKGLRAWVTRRTV